MTDGLLDTRIAWVAGKILDQAAGALVADTADEAAALVDLVDWSEPPGGQPVTGAELAAGGAVLVEAGIGALRGVTGLDVRSLVEGLQVAVLAAIETGSPP